MKKRFISLMLAFVMGIALLTITACGNNDPGPGEAAPAPAAGAGTGAAAAPAGTDAGGGDLITVSVVNWDISQSFGAEPCAIYQFVQDNFGLTFETYDVTWDNFRELPYLWAAAGTLPDIIGASDRILTPAFREWVDAGVIRSIPDDLSRWPNVRHWVDELAQELAINGRIYHIPRGTTLEPGNTAMGRGIINRRDWREQLGIPIPQTEDDFIEMWLAFSENDMHGDGTRVFGVYPHNMHHIFDQTFAGHGYTGPNCTWIDGQMFIPAFEENAFQLMSFWRRAFNEGAINPDFLTDPDSTSIQQFALGRAGTLLRLVVPVHLLAVYEQWRMLQPDVDFFEAVELLAPPRIEGRPLVWAGGPGHWSETLINSRVDDYTLERILDFYDWQMSDEGIRTVMFGFYGQDYTVVNGEIVMLTEINPETGRHLSAADLYQWAVGGMAYLATWSGDAVDWINPNIPVEIRQMAMELRDNVITHPDALFTNEAPGGVLVRALSIPEVVEMGIPTVSDEWVAFMTDNSDLSDRQLWEQFRARWESAGLLRAQELMTAEVLARGYIE